MSWIDRHTRLVNGLLAIFALAIAVVVGEWLTRMFTIRERVVPDPVLGLVINPKVSGWDSRGFRNASALTQADIVAIGDSQTEGNNAPTSDDAWPQVLGKLASTTVYQMAMGGWSPIQYSYLFDKALPLKPKTIVVGFYFGNDLPETAKMVYTNEYWKSLRKDGFVFGMTSTSSPELRVVFQSGLNEGTFAFKLLKFRNWLRSQSSLYTLLGNSTRMLREKAGLAESKEERTERIALWSKSNPDLAYAYDAKEDIKTLLSPAYRLDTVDLSNADTVEGYRIARTLFKEMSDKARREGVRFIIALIPTKEFVYGSFIQSEGEIAPPELRQFVAKETELKREVMSFCRSNQISCHDVAPDLVQSLRANEQVYPHSTDGHPIARGYAVIARSVYSFIFHR